MIWRVSRCISVMIFFDAPMFANGLFQPLGLFGREREADGFRFHFARPREARAGLAERSAINRAGTQIADAGELLSQRGVSGFQDNKTGR